MRITVSVVSLEMLVSVIRVMLWWTEIIWLTVRDCAPTFRSCWIIPLVPGSRCAQLQAYLKRSPTSRQRRHADAPVEAQVRKRQCGGRGAAAPSSQFRFSLKPLQMIGKTRELSRVSIFSSGP